MLTQHKVSGSVVLILALNTHWMCFVDIQKYTLICKDIKKTNTSVVLETKAGKHAPAKHRIDHGQYHTARRNMLLGNHRPGYHCLGGEVDQDRDGHLLSDDR